MERALAVLLAALLPALASCGDDDAAPGDGGAPDAAADAATPVDAGPPTDVEVETISGPVVGRVPAGGDVAFFGGIPYAAPPVGELRWRPPRAPEPWTEPREAFGFSKACPQQAAQLIDRSLGTDEDCLTLNVWVPSDAVEGADLPVMVWIHGGAFVTGSSNYGLYDGESLARGGVVVVSMNYRVGLLGFLAHPAFAAEDSEHPASGNYGLLDQLAAFGWVRDNVRAFGGDPRNVTVFGESAGGMSACALTASPLADGLFHRVAVQSASCLSDHQMIPDDGFAHGEPFVAALGCDGVADPATCLRDKTVEEIVAAEDGTQESFDADERPSPVVDGVVLTTTVAQALRDGDVLPVPMILGTNADEGTILVQGANVDTAEEYERTLLELGGTDHAADLRALYPLADFGGDPTAAAARAVTDVMFVCPARRTAMDRAGHGLETWAYQLTHVNRLGEIAGLGAFHGAELFFLFRDESTLRPEELALSDAMQAWWRTFARTGAPGDAGGLDWPAYERTAEPWMELAIPPVVQEGWPRASRCGALQTVFGDTL